MTKRTLLLALLACSTLFFVTDAVSAAGKGKGRTKMDFKCKLGDATSARFFGKFDVAQAVKNLPAVGTPSLNDELADLTINLYVGSSVFSGTADAKGKVSTPFQAKLTGNGQILQIKTQSGLLDVEKLFPLSTTEGKGQQVVVPLKVTVSNPTVLDPVTGLPVETVLFEQSVTFNYDVKNGQAKGKNF